MKKVIYIYLVVFLFSSSIVHSQIQKGLFFTGGNIGGSIQKIENYSNSAPDEQKGLNITPVFGKVIKENLVLGVDAGISLYNNQQNNAGTKQKQNAYSAGIFLRQYKSIGKGFYLFLQSRLGYRYEKYDYTIAGVNTSNYKRNTISVSATPGISYAVSKRLHLETGLGNLFYLNYSHENGNGYYSGSGKYKANSFNAGVDLNAFNTLYVGFRVFLGS